MKPWAIPIAVVFFLLLSCDQRQGKEADTRTIPSTKLVGTINTDSIALPQVTLITSSNAPKVVRAGKPVMISNPNADGLGDPSFTHYGTEQGLALDNTTCALMDKIGNLWFGSNGGGVSRYDGKQFTNYSAANGMDNGIYAMGQDSAGNLWFYPGNQVIYRYDGITFTDFSSVILKAHNYITCIQGDKKGNSWFGTSEGVVKYEPLTGKITTLTVADGLIDNTVTSIKEDKSGNLWFGTEGGASKYDGIHFINYTKDHGLIRDRIRSIEEDTFGNLWFGTTEGVSKYDGNKFTSYTTDQGLISNWVRIIKADVSGTLWFGTGNGISKYESSENGRPGVFTNYTKLHGLSDNSITSITEDQIGNIWFGTETGGVCKYNRNSLTKYTTTLGLTGNLVKSIIQDKSGNFWFGTDGGGVSKYDGNTFSNYTMEEGLANNSVYSMLQDKAGNIWFGGKATVSKFDGSTFINYSTDQGIPNTKIWNMLEDKFGNLWLTSFGGVSKYDGKSFARYSTAQGLVNENIVSVVQDRNGNIWFSGEGVSQFDGTHFTNYTMTNGLLLSEIPGLMEDATGNIWFGFYGSGASKFHDDYLTTFTTKQGIADNTIFVMREDTTNHRIWFGTNLGLSVLKTDDQTAAYRDTILFENLNRKTGYEINDFSFNFSLFIDKNAVIWAGSSDGKLIRLDYNHLIRNTSPFHLQLKGVSINNENICWSLLKANQKPDKSRDSLATLNEMITTFGKTLSEQEIADMVDKYHDIGFDSISRFYPIPKNLTLPYQKNNVSFEFVAIAPAFENQIKYQYKLEGYDKDWSPLSDKTNASFGNISEGTYTFRLKALNPHGVWSETSYSVKVLPPFYRTWWAYSIYLFTFFGSFRVFIKWRERNLRSEKEKLETKVKERTNELKGTIEHLESTQSQLIQSEKMASLGELTAGIAHEIQNPLNFVNNFSDVNTELIDEMQQELKSGNQDAAISISDNIKDNEQKINHHGKRAAAIVKGMLQHSRSSSGVKEPTDINALADEYLRLAYHGLRAKDKSFNATMKTDFDPNLGSINVIPQDIGRVILNLITNAFYAVAEKKSAFGKASSDEETKYEPTVTVSTHFSLSSGEGRGEAQIRVKDNGPGIPQKVLDKIFQPFFTTKPTGQGTGLGLSLSYDIIKAHGGELRVETREGESAEFIIILPTT